MKSSRQLTGVVFDIQPYSIHDGPGIRTTVFLKGCPLHCQWCHNPESNDSRPQLITYEHLCAGCGRCVSACGNGAIRLENGRAVTDREQCNVCGRCAEPGLCPEKARKISGEKMTVDDVIQKVLQDKIFMTGAGGITVSGGEALAQPEFTLALLREAHTHGITTAIETSGFSTWKIAGPIFGECDYLLYDLKHMNPQSHVRYTGAFLDRIHENFQRAARETATKIWVRLPVIKEVNDSEENARAVRDFILPYQSRIERVCILPYHNLGISKLISLGCSTEVMERFSRPDEQKLMELKELYQKAGFDVHVN